MDASAREAMKDVAKCDKHCELQTSANQQVSQRIVREVYLYSLQACVSVVLPQPLLALMPSVCASCCQLIVCCDQRDTYMLCGTMTHCYSYQSMMDDGLRDLFLYFYSAVLCFHTMGLDQQLHFYFLLSCLYRVQRYYCIGQLLDLALLVLSTSQYST